MYDWVFSLDDFFVTLLLKSMLVIPLILLTLLLLRKYASLNSACKCLSRTSFGKQTVWTLEEQSDLSRSSLIWVDTVCYRDVLKGPTDDLSCD